MLHGLCTIYWSLEVLRFCMTKVNKPETGGKEVDIKKKWGEDGEKIPDIDLGA